MNNPHTGCTRQSRQLKCIVLDPARMETTPMPDGKWPIQGPASLAVLLASQKESNKQVEPGLLVQGQEGKKG